MATDDIQALRKEMIDLDKERFAPGTSAARILQIDARYKELERQHAELAEAKHPNYGTPKLH